MITGTHDGADSASTLRDMDADFRSFGARAGLAIENVTKGYIGKILTVNRTEITVLWSTREAAPVSFGEDILYFGDDELAFGEGGSAVWDQGDTYYIYKTPTKGSIISTNWTDVSRGWKTPKAELKRGWRDDDVDLDHDNHGKVFGPGQPSRNKR